MVRAYCYLMAADVGQAGEDTVVPVLIDSDTTGHAVRSCQTVLSDYAGVNALRVPRVFSQRLELLREPYGSWHPATELKSQTVLDSLVDKNDDSRIFLSACLTGTELAQNITGGYYGRPALGGGFLRGQLSPGKNPDHWSRFGALSAVADADLLVVTGSTFGGTGAAIMPLLVRRLRHMFPGKKIVLAPLLPYFTFDFSDEQKKEAHEKRKLLPEPARFLSNSMVALGQYFDELANDVDDFYLLGSEQPEKNNISEQSIQQRLGDLADVARSGEKQITPLFLHDFLAASAVRNALNDARVSPGRRTARVFVIGSSSPQAQWDQIPFPLRGVTPGANVHPLAVFARFTYLTLFLVDPWIGRNSEADFRRAPFLADLRNDAEGRERWKHLRSFLHSFWGALAGMEITARTPPTDPGFIDVARWLKPVNIGLTEPRLTNAKDYLTVVKSSAPPRRRITDIWARLCERVETHADLVTRLYHLAEGG